MIGVDLSPPVFASRTSKSRSAFAERSKAQFTAFGRALVPQSAIGALPRGPPNCSSVGSTLKSLLRASRTTNVLPRFELKNRSNSSSDATPGLRACAIARRVRLVAIRDGAARTTRCARAIAFLKRMRERLCGEQSARASRSRRSRARERVTESRMNTIKIRSRNYAPSKSLASSVRSPLTSSSLNRAATVSKSLCSHLPMANNIAFAKSNSST